MVIPIISDGSGIPVLKSFMIFPSTIICGLHLSKYISFPLLNNSEWLNIVDVIVSGPILPVLGFSSCIFELPWRCS